MEKCRAVNWSVFIAGRNKHKKYVYAKTQTNSNELTMLHRFVMDCTNNMVVDHINGNTLDNRKINLRIVSRQQNCINRKQNFNNTRGTKGVTWNKRQNKWVAFIHMGKSYKNLGYYDDIDDAINIRKLAEEKRNEIMNL